MMFVQLVASFLQPRLSFPVISTSSVHVETSLRLPADVGRPRRGQLPRRDPGAPPRPGQDEEPHHQEVETPDRHAHPRQLPGHPPQRRLLPHRVRRFCGLMVVEDGGWMFLKDTRSNLKVCCFLQPPVLEWNVCRDQTAVSEASRAEAPVDVSSSTAGGNFTSCVSFFLYLWSSLFFLSFSSLPTSAFLS